MNKNKIVTNEELLVSNMLKMKSTIGILERRGITPYDELLRESKKSK